MNDERVPPCSSFIPHRSSFVLKPERIDVATLESALLRRLVPERDPRVDTWAGIAAGHGYYYQSHLIDEFRELAGTTPGEWLR